MKLTNKQGHCPFCNSTNLEYGIADFVLDDTCLFPYVCKDCKRQGEELYSVQFNGHSVMVNDDYIEVDEDFDYDKEDLGGV